MAEREQTEGERPKSRRKTLIVVVGVGAFCLLAGAAWLLGLLPLGHTSPHHGPQAAAARSMPEAVYVDMPEIMTNLDAGPHRIAFAKLQFKIETDQSEGRPARGAAQRHGSVSPARSASAARGGRRA